MTDTYNLSIILIMKWSELAMESKDKRQGWLKELKVGDKVAINCGSYGYADYRISTVEKITPTGRIQANNTVFDHTGYTMGSSYGGRDNLEPITDDILNFIKRKSLYYKLKNVEWNKLPLDKMEAVAKILELE
jgi:hypothetical protein